jgi:hypothetical protein
VSTTTEKDETRVSIEHNGRSVDMGTLDEFTGRQLSFNVGLPSHKPDFGSVKFSGSVRIDQDLRHGQEVVVTVTDPDGEVLATGQGVVGWPTFKDKTDEYGTTTERIHVVSV